MLSHTAVRRWIPFLGLRSVISSGLDEGGNQSAARRTLQCTQPTRPKVAATRWFYPLQFTSTLIRVESKNKQTKLSKVPPAHSGLRGGRHKALYTTTRETKQLFQNSILSRKIYFGPSLVLSWHGLLVSGQRYLLGVALGGRRPAKSSRVG